MMVTSLGHCCWSGRTVPESRNCRSSCNVCRKIREGGEDVAKGMVSDIEGVWSLGERDVEIHNGWDLCLRGGGGGRGGSVSGGVDGSDGDGGVYGSGGNSGVADGGESVMYRSGRGGGSVVHRSVGRGLSSVG